MKIDNMLLDAGQQDYYDPSFRATLEAHVALLRASAGTYPVMVTLHQAMVYNQDLFGLLLELKVAPQLHWLVMRLNGFYSPFDFNESTTQLIIPSAGEVDILRQGWKTSAVIAT